MDRAVLQHADRHLLLQPVYLAGVYVDGHWRGDYYLPAGSWIAAFPPHLPPPARPAPFLSVVERQERKAAFNTACRNALPETGARRLR